VSLYHDASGLVKGYHQEAGTTEVVAATASAASVATSIVAYAEVRAAFARALREGRVDAAGHAANARPLDADWAQYVVVAADAALVRDASRLIDQHPRHALRAFDAIHLASALVLAAGRPASVTFACWDQRLWRAARDEGLTLLPAAEPA
jgi:hypothetical protein